MITTVCLNPAIDQSAEVECLDIGGTNRLRDIRSVIGGKGINVAIVLKRLQTEVRCVSCVGEADLTFFKQGMKREGVSFHAVSVPGSVRRNLKVVEAGSRRVTELNQQGAQVDTDALVQIELSMVSANTESNAYTALCGSLPPACGPNTYQGIMRGLPDRRWIVDASGDAMRYALSDKPFLIKPNLLELEEITGSKLIDLNAVKNAAVALSKSGVQYAVVSLGEQGALATDGMRTVYAPAMPVTAAFTVGAGDAMLAGLLYGMDRGENVLESLRYGIAAASVCVEAGGVREFSKSRFETLLPGVQTSVL